MIFKTELIVNNSNSNIGFEPFFTWYIYLIHCIKSLHCLNPGIFFTHGLYPIHGIYEIKVFIIYQKPKPLARFVLLKKLCFTSLLQAVLLGPEKLSEKVPPHFNPVFHALLEILFKVRNQHKILRKKVINFESYVFDKKFYFLLKPPKITFRTPKLQTLIKPIFDRRDPKKNTYLIIPYKRVSLLTYFVILLFLCCT